VSVHTLMDAVLPLVRLQARKSGTRVVLESQDAASAPAGDPPPGGASTPLQVRSDRTMIEQVRPAPTQPAPQDTSGHAD